jgi:hypothetical protein
MPLPSRQIGDLLFGQRLDQAVLQAGVGLLMGVGLRVSDSREHCT